MPGKAVFVHDPPEGSASVQSPGPSALGSSTEASQGRTSRHCDDRIKLNKSGQWGNILLHQNTVAPVQVPHSAHASSAESSWLLSTCKPIRRRNFCYSSTPTKTLFLKLRTYVCTVSSIRGGVGFTATIPSIPGASILNNGPGHRRGLLNTSCC